MDGDPEGLALAKAAREALAKRRPQQEAAEADAAAADAPATSLLQQPAAKRAKLQERPPPTCSHEVEVPKDYDPAARALDPAVFGASSCFVFAAAAILPRRFASPNALIFSCAP